MFYDAVPKDKIGAAEICRTLRQLVDDGDTFSGALPEKQ